MGVRGLKHLAMLLGCKIGQSLSSQQTMDRQKRKEEKSKTRQKKSLKQTNKDEIINIEIEVKGWGDTFRLSSVDKFKTKGLKPVPSGLVNMERLSLRKICFSKLG